MPNKADHVLATVQKIVSEILPAQTGVSFAKEARDLLIECCVEFITLISSEANEISEKEAKKTIACDHITKALERLGFSDYVPAVLEAAAEHKEVQKVRARLPLLQIHFQGAATLTIHRDERRKRINLPAAACLWTSSLGCKKNSLQQLGSATHDGTLYYVDIRSEGVRWALLGVYINGFTRVGRQVRPWLGAFLGGGFVSFAFFFFMLQY